MTKEKQLTKIVSQARRDMTVAYASSAYIDEGIARRLIEKGVVLLSCKAGDTVWCIVSGFDEPLEGRVRHITVFDTANIYEISVKGYYAQSCTDGDFGKTVFLTCEEAEKALKEGANA